MHVFITGGAGFIGSTTGERLLARGNRVTALDAFAHGYDAALKKRNADLLERCGGRVVQGDIRNQALLEQLFSEDRPDVVLHMAARTGVRPSLAEPASYMDINITGTTSVLEAMRAGGVGRMVFASSSSIYGARKQGPFRETDSTAVPASPYAATKRAGELLCASWNHLYGMHATCLRLFTVYGPRQRPEMAIRLFAERIRQGLPIRMFGDGSSARDYTYVEDIVSGILAAIDRPLGFEIINLGNGSPVRLDQLIAGLGGALGKEPLIEALPDQPGDVPLTFANVEKAKKLLGYSPKTSVEKGLAAFAAWLEEDGGPTSLID